jgi:hypothetical protein
MALILADRVRETTTTSGTGDIYFGGSVTGYVTLGSVLTDGSTTYYAMIATSGGQWEVGLGTYTALTNSLARTTILSSSNSNAIVNFTSGAKTVIITQPSEKAVYLDASGGAVSPNGSLVINSPTISSPTVSGGTFTNASLATPNISAPTVTNGTFTNATLNSPTINTPTISGGTASFTSVTTTQDTTASTNKGPFNYGTLGFSDTGIAQSAQTSVNSYFQNVIQNTSNGTASSAEFIAYNNNGTTSTNYAAFGINSSGYTGTGSLNAAGYGFLTTGSTDLAIGTSGSNNIRFVINSGATDAVLIDTNSNVGIGASTLTASSLRVSKNITGATTAYGVRNDGAVQSDVTSTALPFTSQVALAASVTATNLHHNYANPAAGGAGSTVTNQSGFYAESTIGTQGATTITNAYGFYGNLAVGTNRYNLYMAGTAPNYFAGGMEQPNTISSNYTITANSNAQWVTPLTISAIVTVPSTSSWTLI